MFKYILKIGSLAVIAAAIVTAPIRVYAQDTDKPAMEKPKTARSKTLPFRGQLTSVDKTQMTIMVGERTFQITSETKITRNGKPAILDDAVVGDNVGGAYKNTDDGKMNATTVNFRTKPEKPEKLEKPEKKAKKKAEEM